MGPMTRLVDATPTRLRLQALAWAGWSLADLARDLGCTRQSVSLIRLGRQASVRWELAARAYHMYLRLAAQPAPDTSSARYTRLLARRAGWGGPGELPLHVHSGLDLDPPAPQAGRDERGGRPPGGEAA